MEIDIIYLVLSLLIGAMVGFLFGLIILKARTSVWRQQLIRSRENQNAEREKFKRQLAEQCQRVRLLDEQLQQSKGEASKLSDALERTQKQVSETEGAIREALEAKSKAMELSEAHKMARQQAEGRLKQSETLSIENQQLVGQLKQQFGTLEQENRELKERASRHSNELQRLRADLSAARGGASTSGLEESIEAFSETNGSLESILNVLLENEGQRAVVLADANGIIVSAVGETHLREGIAATTQLVSSIINQLNGMVPFEKLHSYSLQDVNSNLINGRAFNCAGEIIGLATYGSRQPNERIMDGAQSHLASVLE